MRRQTGLRSLVEEGKLPSHQLPGNAGRMFGPSHLSSRPEGTSRLSLLGQYDGGVLHKSSGWSFLEAPLYSSRALLEVGSAQLALAQSNACSRQTEPGSRHAISEQCPLETSGRSTHKRFRKYGESSAGQRSTSSPQKTTLIVKLIFQRTRMRWLTAGPTSSFMLFPRSL